MPEREQRGQKQLREKAVLDRVAEISPIGIVLVDRNEQLIFANPRAEEVLELTKDEIAQRTYNAPSWHITDYEGNPFPNEKLPFKRVMSTRQQVRGVQHAIEWPNGDRRYLSINGAPLSDDSGEIEYIVPSVEDITERKKAEEKIKQQLHEFQRWHDVTLDREDRVKALEQEVNQLPKELGEPPGMSARTQKKSMR